MNQKKGFLCLARQVGQSLIIGDDLELTLEKLGNGRAVLRVGEYKYHLGLQDGVSVTKDVYVVLYKFIFDGAILAIHAPKHIRVDRKEIRERIDAGLPMPEKLAENHLERQKRIDY